MQQQKRKEMRNKKKIRILLLNALNIGVYGDVFLFACYSQCTLLLCVFSTEQEEEDNTQESNNNERRNL